MTRGFLIQLTNNLYRLTLLFPKKEPLRYKMREVADEILIKPNEKNLEVLDNFFGVAAVQNWVSSSEILAIQTEYANLREELKKKNNPGENPIVEVQPQQVLQPQPILENQTVSEKNERQEKILAFLKENGRVQVWQIKQVFPEVTKRTLRRDFEYMLRQGVIERIGERNNTFYQTKTVQS